VDADAVHTCTYMDKLQISLKLVNSNRIE